MQATANEDHLRVSTRRRESLLDDGKPALKGSRHRFLSSTARSRASSSIQAAGRAEAGGQVL